MDEEDRSKQAPPLRTRVGAFLALEWNMPLVFAFVYSWQVFLYSISANSLLWALVILAMAYCPRWRLLAFRIEQFDPEPIRRLRVLGGGMLVLSAVILLISLFR